MLQPKVGDTIILRAVVDSINSDPDTMKVRFIDCAKPGSFSKDILSGRVHEIIPREPQVGDTVWYAERANLYSASPFHGVTLLYIHQAEGDERKWGVVAFQGDIPRGVYFKDLRLDR